MSGKYHGVERRRRPRFFTETVASIVAAGVQVECRVRNLSACGVLLSQALELSVGTPVTVTLRVPESPPIRVKGRVVRHDDSQADARLTAIAFVHETDATEDEIQAALLVELESSRRNSA